MKEIDWSQEQLSVIEESGDSRLVVDAGPGTGKTAVACKRIASLVDTGFCHPHEIIVVSFTNTAVYEIRERIKNYISDASLVSNIRVTTLDSFAGKLRAGFDSMSKGAITFDENISRASTFNFECIRFFFRKMWHGLLASDTERGLAVTFAVTSRHRISV